MSVTENAESGIHSGKPPAKTSSVYIAAPEGGTGKSAVALGLLHLLAATVPRVGVFRSIGSASERDHVLESMLEHTTAGLSYEQCVGITYDQFQRDPDNAIGDVVRRYHEVAQHCDAVVVIGSDYSDVVGSNEFALNGRIAGNLGAPVLLVLSGRDRTPADLAKAAEVCVSGLRDAHAHTAAIIVNRADPHGLEDVRSAIESVALPGWAIPEDPVMAAPTMNEVMAAINGALFSGDPELLRREALGVLVAGGNAEHVLERLTEGVAVIVPADRPDVVFTLLAAHQVPEFPSLSGIVFDAGVKPEPAINSLLGGLQQTLPIVTTELDSFNTAATVYGTRGRIDAGSLQKVNTALALVEKYVDGQALLDALQVPIPSVVTPQSFTHSVIDKARALHSHIVLPEGDDDRTLQAAGRLLQRQAAEFTILGDAARMRQRSAELGIDLSAAHLIDPTQSDLRSGFAAEYAKLRAHKGMTEERAFEIMGEVIYFGTMMVHMGLADGMVAGAAHTTAYTIRPAFEIIKTEPGVSTVSGIIFACHPSKVLAFADCAIVPNPTTEQLADIAIASAATAAKFGLEPRVALLSYATGSSGSGEDVERVRAATALVRERRPDLPVEGPIQFDAATDPRVGKSKLPDSEVAGRATVLIFPDLNTGNNTIKAVLQNAPAVQVGTVLQGLRKPINDLSRGASVDDIVNTIAVTAVQAGRQKEAAES